MRLIRKRCGCHKIRKEVENEWECSKSRVVGWQRLHEMTGISIFTISQFENGKGQGLSLSHFLLLMDAVGLEMTLSDLIPVVSEIDPEKMWMSQNKKGGRK